MDKLPDCMMPDGADPCVAYQELLTENEAMKKVLIEAMRLLKNGACGSISDTVWSDSVPNATLYELMHNLTNKD